MLNALVLIKKCFALLFALAVLVGLMLMAGADDFKSAFLSSYGMWLIIDWYDVRIHSVSADRRLRTDSNRKMFALQTESGAKSPQASI